jgi:hypothetical protein
MQFSCIQAGVYLQVKIVPRYTQFVIFLFYMDLNVDFYFYIGFLFSFDGVNRGFQHLLTSLPKAYKIHIAVRLKIEINCKTRNKPS